MVDTPEVKIADSKTLDKMGKVLGVSANDVPVLFGGKYVLTRASREMSSTNSRSLGVRTLRSMGKILVGRQGIRLSIYLKRQMLRSN